MFNLEICPSMASFEEVKNRVTSLESNAVMKSGSTMTGNLNFTNTSDSQACVNVNDSRYNASSTSSAVEPRAFKRRVAHSQEYLLLSLQAILQTQATFSLWDMPIPTLTQ